jgi:hypothetical protein
MKQYKFPVRDSGINPFLTNPIQAVTQTDTDQRKLDLFLIQHAVLHHNGISVYGRFEHEPINTYRCLNMIQDNVRIANTHEADRFETMLEWLKISI